mmetsp:Transcript_5900/g.10062  ORF Transcript_5900/g.10062 Transcript_5900/m.10062 type:complete len:208 (+) Transcript_5900:1247-1870(+)
MLDSGAIDVNAGKAGGGGRFACSSRESRGEVGLVLAHVEGHVLLGLLLVDGEALLHLELEDAAGEDVVGLEVVGEVGHFLEGVHDHLADVGVGGGLLDHDEVLAGALLELLVPVVLVLGEDGGDLGLEGGAVLEHLHVGGEQDGLGGVGDEEEVVVEDGVLLLDRLPVLLRDQVPELREHIRPNLHHRLVQRGRLHHVVEAQAGVAL